MHMVRIVPVLVGIFLGLMRGTPIPPEPAEGQFFTIALTGGPCAGKTTVLSKLSDAFQNLGWRVYRASEVASVVLSGGIDFPSMNSEEVFLLQKNLFKTMMSLEQVYRELGQSATRKSENCVLICDRGAMDVSAYMEPEEWQRLLHTIGKSEIELRDERYDCVIHMRTAADGAEAFYNVEGNAARKEGPELAKELDDKVMKAWMGHPYFSLIDNSTDFNTKLDRTIGVALFRAGLQDIRSTALSKRRKFLLPPHQLPAIPPVTKHLDFEVEHLMLFPSEDGKTFFRLRKRGSNGNFIYTLASSKVTDAEMQIESRRNLSGREYESMLKFADPAYVPIQKARRVFVHQGHFYQIDLFRSKQDGLVLMEAYIPPSIGIDQLPAFLPAPLAEVTEDPTYKLINLSRI